MCVMSPYNNQLNYIKELLFNYSDLNILTIDKAQGKEYNISIISLVKSKPNNNFIKNTGLLADIRRLNVGITRSRSKLILIGNKKRLVEISDACENMISAIEKIGNIVNLDQINSNKLIKNLENL